MSNDLIKRSDVLFIIDAFKRDFEQSWKVQFSADIKALPAVPTHSYAGESEASVYDRKGFPPIGLQGHAHAPVADSHPAIDTAACRNDPRPDRRKEMTDLIKRDDALAAITLGATVITLQSRIRTLPAVDPVVIHQVDPAAIREAALRDAAEVAHELSLRWGAHSVKAAILALIKGETK
jgi:hypothetical protein